MTKPSVMNHEENQHFSQMDDTTSISTDYNTAHLPGILKITAINFYGYLRSH